MRQRFQEIPINLVHTRAAALLAAFFVLASPAMAKSDLPLLKAGLTSQNYEVVFLKRSFMAYISFHRPGRFFIVGNEITTDLVKMNATGQEIFRLEHSADNFRPRFSSYVTTRRGIYDLSQPRPRLIPIAQVYNNTERNLSGEKFAASFPKLYAAAEVVVYGAYNGQNYKSSIYLRTGGKWAIFYFSRRAVAYNLDKDLGNSIEGFPPKYERMVLLRDLASKRYSYSDYRLRDRKIRLPEDKLRYSRATKLKKLSYRTRSVTEQVPYTPIPTLLRGVATYRLTVGGETMEFAEMATRGTLSLRTNSNLNLFVVPKAYEQAVPVSFLEFRPGSNAQTLGSDGLYVIRPKR